MKTILAIAIIWFSLVGILWYFISNAPEGHEDDDGFHPKE
jgi:hypothetical protein